jgi:LysM domain
MSVMRAAEAGQTGDAGPDLPVPRRRLRVAAPAPDQDRGDGPESLFGPSSEAESGPDANAGGPRTAGTDVRTSEVRTSEVRTSEVRSTELRVREVRVVRRARTVRRQAGAGPGQARAAQLQASEVTARSGTATQVRAGYTRAASIPAQRTRPGMPIATRARMAAQSSTVTRTQVVARTRTTRRSQRPGAIRLTRRGRLVVAGFAMLLVIVAATVLWMTAAGSVQASSQGGTPASPYQGMTQVVVMPGQTLWSIAAAAEPSANTWTVVQQITEVNALSSTAVHAGQSLWVPKG